MGHARSLTLLSVEEGIDVWMQYPAPFGGQGSNQSADLVVPQQILTLTAQVVNNYSPLANANVTFEIRDNNLNLLKVMKSATDAYGMASIVYEMPWPSENPESLFGLWQVRALTNATGVWLRDTMSFWYDYLVRVWGLSTNKIQYEHLETVKATVVFGTLAQHIYNVSVTTGAQDSLQEPFGLCVAAKTIGGGAFGVYKNYTNTASIRIPYWACAGWSLIQVNVLDRAPSEGGTSVTPEAKNIIWILPSIRLKPTADFSFDPENPRVRRTVQFNATASTSGWSQSNWAPTQIIDYVWSFGDGSADDTGASPVTTHVYENASSFQVALTVVDEEGQSDSIVQTVSAWAVRDISLTHLTTSKTIVGQGSEDSIRITIKNEGDLTETFFIAVYADLDANVTGDEIIIERQTITLPYENSTTLDLTFQTQGVPKGKYTLTGYAPPLPNETDTADNTINSVWIIISIIGDLTGPEGVPDGKVDIRDIAFLARLFGLNLSDPRFNANCDFNSDGKLDIVDLAVIAREYGKEGS
jgi:PKD repeat protein